VPESHSTDPAQRGRNLRRYIDAAGTICRSSASRRCASRDTCDHVDLRKRCGMRLCPGERSRAQGFQDKLFADMDRATPPDSIIASSSSGLTDDGDAVCLCASEVASSVIIHPPAGRSVGRDRCGEKTSAQTVQTGRSSFTPHRQKPIHLRKKWSGMYEPSASGALSRGRLPDRKGVLRRRRRRSAVCWGPGLRWVSWDRICLFHLGGGKADPALMDHSRVGRKLVKDLGHSLNSHGGEEDDHRRGD